MEGRDLQEVDGMFPWDSQPEASHVGYGVEVLDRREEWG